MKTTFTRKQPMHGARAGRRRRPVAVAMLLVLALGYVGVASPVSAFKIENPLRYIQIGAHLLSPPDGIPHPFSLPGTYWATPYTWAGAPAAAVSGSSQHVFAPHPGPPWYEPPLGPVHTYSLSVTPAVPAPRAVAAGRLLHGTLHPDVFVEVLAANLTAAVFADIGVHDPPPGNCPGFQASPSGEEAVPPTPSDAVSAAAITLYSPDGTLSLGASVAGIELGDVISSGIYRGEPGEVGPLVVDLGSGVAWVDLDGIAIGRVLEDVPLLPQDIDALLQNELYLNIATTAYPDGEIRGQIRMMPWEESFDTRLAGSSMHGQGEWKGWGDDAALTAYVTADKARTDPHALDVAGGTDIVREFEGRTSGAWQFTTWTYVPGDFQSGGEPPFLGSYFILLNTYSDEGPWEEGHWSCQMNFDSNDGMLKVYYGNGLNTVDVPYVPEEWVQLNVRIDLDSDLCTVYYDDQYVVEYPWTGGATGVGGGALNIAAVDLHANGSTSVYYDDFELSTAAAEDPPVWCLGDMDCSGGSPDFADILYFSAAIGDEAGWVQYYRDRHAGEDPPCFWLLGDFTGGGVEFTDIIPFANSIGQECIVFGH